MRKKRFEFLKKRSGKTAWEMRQNGQMSYLEKWFYEKVIIKYKMFEKYDIINEYPFYPYFIDFAFMNIKLAVELDGGTHFNQDGSYIERDIKKNNHLLKNGWNIYRINYQESNVDKIHEFIEYLKTIDIENPKILSNKLYKGKIKQFSTQKRKYGNREDYAEAKFKEYLASQQGKIKTLQESEINFQKFGWGKYVSKLIDINPHKIAWWMKRCCPEIWEKAYKTKRAIL